jgi:hypothetical protein
MPKFQDQQHCYGILCIALFGSKKGLWACYCSLKKKPILMNCDCKASKLHAISPNLSNATLICMHQHQEHLQHHPQQHS